MSGRSFTIKELGFDPRKLGPNSPLRNARAPRANHEHEEQRKLFAWAAENESRIPELRWLFAVPNWFGVKTRYHGARAKMEGRKPGVLDVWWPLYRMPYVGLVIEMKYGRNTLSREQREWKAWLESQGWLVVVKYSALDAQDTITRYHSSQPL